LYIEGRERRTNELDESKLQRDKYYTKVVTIGVLCRCYAYVGGDDLTTTTFNIIK